ncbi:hypothetical protein BDV93DRAFT_565007 [Ceratobasidium sp. AG-I]|nr:hypothetical protein BDV93DRAFT_565007 [Ceratobasidium sp. AG-I]
MLPDYSVGRLALIFALTPSRDDPEPILMAYVQRFTSIPRTPSGTSGFYAVAKAVDCGASRFETIAAAQLARPCPLSPLIKGPATRGVLGTLVVHFPQEMLRPLHQQRHSPSLTSSYLPTPASSVRNLPVVYSSTPNSAANVLLSYTSTDHSFAYPSPHSETANIEPSHLSQNTSSSILEPSYSYSYSMSHASTHAPMMSQPRLPPVLVFHASSPPPVQVNDKDQSKHDISSAPASPSTPAATAAQKAKKKHVCTTCSESISTSGHLTRRWAIAHAIESAVHDDLTGQGVHTTHLLAHPHPYPLPYPPPHPHYSAAPSYGAYPQYPLPSSLPVHPGQPQFMPAPGQPHIHYPYPPPMTYAYPPPRPGQPPVDMHSPPQAPPPGHHAAIHNGHHPQYAPYPPALCPPQRPAPGQNGSAPGCPPQQSPHQSAQQAMQLTATIRAAVTSGSNSPMQQSLRMAQAGPLSAANAPGLQNGVNLMPMSNQWNGAVDPNKSPDKM